MSEQNPRWKPELSPAAVAGMALALICGISLYIRIALPHDLVFVNGWVWFTGTDAWYHMRLADNLLHHFPQRIFFDPYTYYPHGAALSWPPFFDWLIVGISWLVSLGSPSEHTLDVVGAYLPPILGTLTLLPVYIIGRELFNRWTGTIAAALLAILPGEFLHRSLLGFTDHHVAETLFSTLTIMFLVLAVKRARENQFSLAHLEKGEWAVVGKPVIYSLLAGIFLGVYLLTWVGGLMLIFTLFAWLVIQFIIDHLTGKPTVYLGVIGVLCFLVASALSLPLVGPIWPLKLMRLSLPIAIATPLVLGAISEVMRRRNLRAVYYLAAVLVLAGLSLAVLRLLDPWLLKSMLNSFHVFAPSGAALTIAEVQPLTPDVAWERFTTSFFIGFVSLGMIVYLFVKERRSDHMLFLVWSLIMLAAVLGQRRFSYYFAVNASLLTGYFCWRVVELAGLRRLTIKAKEASRPAPPEGVKKKKSREKAQRKTAMQIRKSRLALVVVLFFLVFSPNIGRAVAVAREAANIDPAWYQALLWLRENSAEPFDDPDFYYQLYDTPFKYPDCAYGVISWWDYGHWITGIARRIPVSNPFQQGAAEVARFFVSQDLESANKIIEELDSRYVIVDYLMATGKFHAMATWAGHSKEEFYEVYYQAEGGVLKSVVLYYPAYYRSTVVRLYNFDGRAVTPQECTVIAYEERATREGKSYKVITGWKSFASYDEAQAFLSGGDGGKYVVASSDPFVSPVPLGEMEHYRLVYSSPEKWQGRAAVKIFEYAK